MVDIEATEWNNTRHIMGEHERYSRSKPTIIETYTYKFERGLQKLQIIVEILEVLKYVVVRLYMAELPFIVPKLVFYCTIVFHRYPSMTLQSSVRYQ